MGIKLCTWNINSVRLRLPLLKRLAETYAPDLIALQETKVVDADFPADAIRAMGYPYLHFSGMKSYNGVAIASKRPFSATAIHDRVGRNDCRHIAVHLSDPAWSVHCLYVPAGGDIPDRDLNDKFAHKLDLVADIATWFPNQHRPDDPVIVMGDFNIAPLEHDVWSHKQLMDVVSHTPIEIAALAHFQHGLRWVDAIRHFVPNDQKCYTWWSYRNRDWKKSNRGRRLDHIWVTPALYDQLAGHQILIEARDWPQPSDHVPVIVEFSGA